MKIQQIVEGGWTSTATQDTKITPPLVKAVLPVVKQFISGFNNWLKTQNMPPMKMGVPVGSTAYYQQDDDDTVYGDIDLQTVAPDMPDKNDSQVGRIYNKLMDQYIAETKPTQVDDSQPAAGQPIFKVGDQFVQVDFVWSTEKYADWSRYRMTPARGVKGTVHGSIFSSLGNVIEMSIQGAGAQMKIKDGMPAQYAKTRKPDSIEVLTSNMQTFGIDILRWMHNKMELQDPLRVAPLLKANPGLDTKDIQSKQLTDVVKGLADSFALNDMYGKFNLSKLNNRQELIDVFIADFTAKMQKSATASKFDKAESPEAKAVADATKAKFIKGIDFIKQLMQD